MIPSAELQFSFARSGGPGGQNVNKVNSKALLRWDFARNMTLPAGMRERFLQRYGSQLTVEGELLIVSDRFRDRLRNQEDCLEKLRAILLSVLHPPKPRKKTKPSRAAKERRKEKKRQHGDKKRSRSKGSWDV